MRPTPIALAAVLAAMVSVGAAHAHRINTRRIAVVAKLVAMPEGTVMCGTLHVGAILEYERVQAPRRFAIPKRFKVAVGCVELPRPQYDKDAGSLQAFKIGDVHDLVISTDARDGRGMSVLARKGEKYFYLISADPH